MKAFMKPMALMCVLSIFSGCMPKYTVKYEVFPSENRIAELKNKRLGVLLLEDSRPKYESEGSGGSKICMADSKFEQAVPVMVTDLLVKHFAGSQGNNDSTFRIDNDSNAVSLDTLDKIKKEGISDFVLLGNIKHYTANLYDEHFGIRMVGSFIAGFTVVGLVFMPLILSGNVEVSSEIELDNIMLISLDGPQILWKGRAYTTSKEETLLFGANNQDMVKAYELNTKKTLENLYNNIVLASDLGFPHKYSIEDSKKILNHIKQTGSITNLNL